MAARIFTTVVLLFFIFLASLLRLVSLPSFPKGLHGDEAWTGIRAHDILRDGWIGFFDPVHSLGQWSLPQYVTVPAVLLIEDPILAVRFPMAVAGVLSVLFFALFLKNTLGYFGACVGTAVLAVFPVHVMLSRVGFPPILGALFVSIGLFALSRLLVAPERRKVWLFGCGVALGMSVISYGATPAFVGSLGLGLLLVPSVVGTRFVERILALLFVGMGLCVVLLPVFLVEWANGALLTRGFVALGGESRFDLARLWEMVAGLFWRAKLDGSDGLGSSVILDPLFLFLCALGIFGGVVWGERKEKTGSLVWPFAVCLVLSFALTTFASVNVGYGYYRRLLPTLLLAVWFVARGATILKPLARGYVASAAALAVIFWQGQKLWLLYNDPGVSWTYASDLAEASLWARGFVAKKAVLIFSSGRWPGEYETNRYLSQSLREEWERVENVKNEEELSVALQTGNKHVVLIFPDRVHLLDSLDAHERDRLTCQNFQRFHGCISNHL